MPYQYVTSLHRYRDVETGQFVARETIFGYTESLIAAGSNASDVLTGMYHDGGLSVDDYITRLQGEVKSTHIQEIVLGRGGRESMTPRDWGSAGAMLKAQYALMEGFRADLNAGALSDAQIHARARLYFQSAAEAYERGNAAAHGVYNLPSYPGDHHQTCHGGCKCHWRFEEVRDEEGNLIAMHAYWELFSAADHCEPDLNTRGCVQNSLEYNPLVLLVG